MNEQSQPQTPRQELEAASLPSVHRNGQQGYVLITGGAGFIGTNLAHRLLNSGQRVLLLDTLARAGVQLNWQWLKSLHGERVKLQQADVRDYDAVQAAVAGASSVFHFAAQVAVTTSIDDPLHDFEVNARGTLNVLEAIRRSRTRPPLLFTSTNKVYGSLDHVELKQNDGRYEPTDANITSCGVSESALNFHGPYGCSKGAADQYVLDYARTFDLRTAVFRMSCIYGPHQHGNEDQGWVAHFLIRALQGQPITLYGDGKQVRDLLYVDDLIDAMGLAMGHIDHLRGRAFNIGGGPANTISLLELAQVIAKIQGKPPQLIHDRWRLGDQRYYVSDAGLFRESTGWSPKVSVHEGVSRLHHWLKLASKRPGRQSTAAGTGRESS